MICKLGTEFMTAPRILIALRVGSIRLIELTGEADPAGHGNRDTRMTPMSGRDMLLRKHLTVTLVVIQPMNTRPVFSPTQQCSLADQRRAAYSASCSNSDRFMHVSRG